VCTNKVPGVINGHILRGPSFVFRFIYMYIANNLKIFFSWTSRSNAKLFGMDHPNDM